MKHSNSGQDVALPCAMWEPAAVGSFCPLQEEQIDC